MGHEHEVMLAFIGGVGWQELLIVLVIVMIIFGAGKLPQVGRSLGSAISEFKSSVRNGEDDEKKKDTTGEQPLH